MTYIFDGIEPQMVWKQFSQLNAIPRASKKERQVIDFMKSFGADLGLVTIEDEIGNVLIKKSATLGYESKSTVVMQGHLDMVHQKNSEVDFDFANSGIDMYVDGDWVRARGTTLGADNGIGVAAIMAVLASDDLPHPPLEAIFTIDEEIGMSGAMGLKKGFHSGKILLNLDSEEDTALTVGSAGGVDVIIEGTYNPVVNNEITFFDLKVEGLTGGHSGVDIHKGLCNAIKLLNRILYEINKDLYLHVSAIIGGDLTNAIPRECKATIGVSESSIGDFKEKLEHWTAILKAENEYSDPDLNVECTAISSTPRILPPQLQNQLIASIYNCPNGIYRMTPALNHLVQSSNNLAKINVEEGRISLSCHTRSFMESERDDLVNVIRSSFSPMAVTVTEDGPYPGWSPNPNTQTVATMKRVYESLYGAPPEILAIHAGLECGILAETYPHLELISFGPNITGAHSPDEALQISSTQKFWEYLKAVLSQL